MNPKIIVTGGPGSGKTTLARQLVEATQSIKVAGFYTVEEPDEKGKSQLVLKIIGGPSVVFGSQGKAKSKVPQVGKFMIDVDAFDELAVEAISFHPEVDLYVMDEIGPALTLSRMFSATAKMLLQNDKTRVVVTVSKQGRGFVREVKRLPGAHQIELSEQNRDSVIRDVLTRIAQSMQEPTKTEGSA